MAAVTYPKYKISGVGFTTPPQISDIQEFSNIPQPPLAEVFCANVFGHYLLTHQLMPLLTQPLSAGRIIWISSLEAVASTLSPVDMQCLYGPLAYESSKRLTDVLALTSRLPSTRPFVSCFASPPQSSRPPANPPLTAKEKKTPAMYVAHPGICATAIVPLPLILHTLMKIAFYLARWLGSPWHTIQAYKGACAPTWLALSSDEELDAACHERSSVADEMYSHNKNNGGGGGCRPSKWGSSTDRRGRECVARTAVEGEEEEGWERLGQRCWAQMEELRQEWEERLDGAGAGAGAGGENMGPVPR